jgi:hypothetical protein
MWRIGHDGPKNCQLQSENLTSLGASSVSINVDRGTEGRHCGWGEIHDERTVYGKHNHQFPRRHHAIPIWLRNPAVFTFKSILFIRETTMQRKYMDIKKYVR